LTGCASSQPRRRPPRRRRRSMGTPTSSTPPTTAPATTTTTAATETPTDLARWSDPATWGGKVPGSGDRATVTRPVLLDVDTRVAGVLVEAAGQLVFDPATSHTLTTSANVVVKGVLRMRPASPAVHQVLAFVGIDEARFVGGDTHTTMDTDVGLWLVEAGRLDARGASKAAWTHLAAAARPGAGAISVDDTAGWQVGDEIVVTPTEPHDYGDHYKHHDRRTVKAVSGKTVTLDKALDHDHPFVTVRPGVTHRAEVLNLSRNVRIEGQPDARAHVIQLHGTVPQAIGWIQLRNLGPKAVKGRYSLHFHMCDDASRGSTVEGVVAVDTANRAFVPHLSNGVSFTDCLVHDSVRDAFWWDPAGDGQEAGDVPSDDILWDRCVASFIEHGDGEGEPHSNSGFMMGAGKGNVIRNCVATGVSGRSEGATGFQWNAGSNDETNPWTFEDNLAHNNTHSALFYWQNNAPKTIVDRFTAYNCGQGIYAGSYINLVSYRDCNVYACADWGLNVRATPSGVTGQTITYDGMYIDQAGRGDFGVMIQEHTLSDDVVTKFTGGTFKGANKAQVGFPSGGELRQMYDFVDCTFEGNAFWVAQGVPADSQIRVLRGNLGSVLVHPPGGPGTRKAAWNGTVTPA
ncbi:MAG TPA: hypothetical protein VGO78_24545, partial [Acidimicrobiales bacterium]|nr:hypothetical protein [Acidimicrobiales bacterium]